MPIAYPVTRKVANAIHARVDRETGVEVMLLGQGSVVEGVAVYLASDRELSKEFREELRVIVREAMHNPDLTVRVMVVKSAMDDWSSREPD